MACSRVWLATSGAGVASSASRKQPEAISETCRKFLDSKRMDARCGQFDCQRYTAGRSPNYNCEPQEISVFPRRAEAASGFSRFFSSRREDSSDGDPYLEKSEIEFAVSTQMDVAGEPVAAKSGKGDET